MQHVAQQIASLLANNTVTFANITTVTPVKTAAAFKHVSITKETVANVQLFGSIDADTSVYTNAVQRSATRIADNNATNVADFEAQSNYFEHTAACYSITQHKKNPSALYLYCIYNSAKSVYYINGAQATKDDVATYLTKSDAAKLKDSNPVERNVTHDVLHTVKVRNVSLKNLRSITANKQTLVF